MFIIFKGKITSIIYSINASCSSYGSLKYIRLKLCIILIKLKNIFTTKLINCYDYCYLLIKINFNQQEDRFCELNFSGTV
jgi:hypothetical protein